jgi:hypothetical protein
VLPRRFAKGETMSLRPYLIDQLTRHPSMTPQDLAKLCYQAARGAEHMIPDPERARAYLTRELEATEADGMIPLYEAISPKIVRVNLAAWKARGFSCEDLLALFLSTAKSSVSGEDLLPAYLEEVTALLTAGDYPVTAHEWESFLRVYQELGMPAVHHSEAYRLREKPAYRIVRAELLKSYTD